MSPVSRFTLIAFGISWVVLLPSTLESMGVHSFGLPAQWHGLAALGPLIAAFVMYRSRDSGFRILDLYRGRRTRGIGSVRTIALASTPVFFLGIALVVSHAIEGSAAAMPSLGWLISPRQLTDLVVVCVVYGFGEEPGWRGWLLPRLQERHNPLRSTLIVALIWAVWHAPFLVSGARLDGAGGIIAFFIGLLAAAFWLTFLYNSTGGSVLAVSTWHTLWNAASLVARPSATAATMLGVLLTVTGFSLAVVFGRRGLAIARAESR